MPKLTTNPHRSENNYCKLEHYEIDEALHVHRVNVVTHSDISCHTSLCVGVDAECWLNECNKICCTIVPLRVHVFVASSM